MKPKERKGGKGEGREGEREMGGRGVLKFVIKNLNSLSILSFYSPESDTSRY